MREEKKKVKVKTRFRKEIKILSFPSEFTSVFRKTQGKVDFHHLLFGIREEGREGKKSYIYIYIL